jgi:phosphohistidine phosphatase SixA
MRRVSPEQSKTAGGCRQGVVSSDAVRAVETFERMCSAWSQTPDVELTRDLYQADPVAILSVIRQFFDKSPVDSSHPVAIVGHNPGLEGAVAILTGSEERLTTANAALLQRDSTDEGTGTGATWNCTAILRPKEL